MNMLTALPFLQADVSSIMLLSGFTNCQSSCSSGITQVCGCCCVAALSCMDMAQSLRSLQTTLAAVHAWTGAAFGRLCMRTDSVCCAHRHNMAVCLPLRCNPSLRSLPRRQILQPAPRTASASSPSQQPQQRQQQQPASRPPAHGCCLLTMTWRVRSWWTMRSCSQRRTGSGQQVREAGAGGDCASMLL